MQILLMAVSTDNHKLLRLKMDILIQRIGWSPAVCMCWVLFILVLDDVAQGQGWSDLEPSFTETIGYASFDSVREGASSVSALGYNNETTYHRVEQNSFVWLPTGVIYPTYLSHPHEPRVGTQWVSDKEDGLLWESSLGGRSGSFGGGLLSLQAVSNSILWAESP